LIIRRVNCSTYSNGYRIIKDDCLLLIAHCPLPIANCLLPIAHSTRIYSFTFISMRTVKTLKTFFSFFLILVTIQFLSSTCVFPQISIATDFSVLRNFKKDQRFWSIGQSVQGHFHITPRDGAYIMFSYYTIGKFSNQLVAKAKSIGINPQQFNFFSNAQMRLRHLSIGWKRYLKGAYNSDGTWNLYGFAGFGLMMGKMINTYDRLIDTSMYNTPSNPINGSGSFTRLTLDLAGGWEIPVGGDFYLYIEGRAWVPASDYPSEYLLVNDHAPLIATLHFGLRILFD